MERTFGLYFVSTAYVIVLHGSLFVLILYIDFCGIIMTSFLIQQVDSETPLQMRGLNFEHLLDGD